MYVSGVELGGFFEEPETGMSVNDVLDERHEVFWHEGSLAEAAL